MAMADCNTFGYAARDPSGYLSPFAFNRRAVGPADVEFSIKFCGVCHTDLHQIRGDWGNSTFPMVPGHELVGLVTKIGVDVTEFKLGDHVGVGCLVNSCHKCDCCRKNLEQYCPKAVFTYNSFEKDGTPTYGGYSNRMVCNKKFVLHIPENLPLDSAAPLLCAGITVYSPIKYYGLNEPGKSLGVLGLGGLGHMAVKIGKAFGQKVVVLSTSPGKKHEAVDLLGSDEFVFSKNKEEMKAAAGSLDYIIDTVSANHSLSEYLNLLKVDGKYIIVGIPTEPYKISATDLVFGRKAIGGSLIGGIKETQEMLNFCGKHNITSNIEKISIDYVNIAMERLAKGDVKYRFVIDLDFFMT